MPWLVVEVMTALRSSACRSFAVTGSFQLVDFFEWPEWLRLIANQSAYTTALEHLPSSLERLDLGLDYDDAVSADDLEMVRAHIEWLTMTGASVGRRIGDGSWPRLKSLCLYWDWPRRALAQDYPSSISSALRRLARSMRELERMCTARGIQVVGAGSRTWCLS